MSILGWREWVFLTVALLAITIVMTYPLILHWQEWVPGDYDVYWSLWNLWRFKSTWNAQGDIFFSNMIFYPTGASLYLSTTMPLISALSMPLQDWLGLFGAYNILLLSTYITAGWCMYGLARKVVGDGQASFLAAIIFAFSPYHAARVFRHFNLAMTFILPLFAWTYLNLKDNPSRKNVLIAAVALIMAAYIEMIYFTLCILFMVADVLYDWKVKNDLNKYANGLAMMGIVAAVAITPYAGHMLYELIFVKYVLSSNLAFSIGFSPDIFEWIVPPWFNPILSPYFQEVYPWLHQRNLFNLSNPLLDVEGVVYIGLTVLALAIYSRGRTKAEEEQIKRWKIIGLVAVIFAVGPAINLLGNTLPILMPYFFAYSAIPLFWVLRVPSRFDIVVMMAVALLAAVGYWRLREALEAQGRTWIAKGLLGLLLVLVLVEFWAPIPKYLNTHVSPIYQQIGPDQDQYAILDVPHETHGQFSTYNAWLLYLQTIHQKPVVGGALSRTPEKELEFMSGHCKASLMNLSFSEGCSLTEYNQTLSKGIRYIIYHKRDYPQWLDHDTTYAKAKLKDIFGPPVMQDKELEVYCRFNCSTFT